MPDIINEKTKIHVDSFDALVKDIKSKRDDLYELAKKTHSIAFDLVWADIVDSSDEERKEWNRQVYENKKTFRKLIQERYDFDFEIGDTDLFNKIIMPVSKIEWDPNSEAEKHYREWYKKNCEKEKSNS